MKYLGKTDFVPIVPIATIYIYIAILYVIPAQRLKLR